MLSFPYHYTVQYNKTNYMGLVSNILHFLPFLTSFLLQLHQCRYLLLSTTFRVEVLHYSTHSLVPDYFSTPKTLFKQITTWCAYSPLSLITMITPKDDIFFLNREFCFSQSNPIPRKYTGLLCYRY